MKKTICISVFIVIIAFTGVSHAENEGNLIRNEIKTELRKYDFAEWQRYFSELPLEIQTLLGENVDDLVSNYANGEVDTDGLSVFKTIGNMLKASIKKNVISLTAVFVIGILSGISSALTEGASLTSGRNAAAYVCTLVCVLMLMRQMAEIITVAKDAVNALVGFTDVSMPILTTAIAAAGSVGTSGMLTPLSAFLNTGVAKLFEIAILPLTLALTATSAIGSVADGGELEQVSKLIKTVLKWVIGIVFTIYLGMLTVQGIATCSADTIALKSAKFALDKSVPVVGSVVSGTLSTVLSCAGMIKNAAGISAVIIAGGYLLMPLLNIGGTMFAFRIGAALCETVADKKICYLLDSLADACNYLFAAVVSVGLMFMITLGICIMVGG